MFNPLKFISASVYLSCYLLFLYFEVDEIKSHASKFWAGLIQLSACTSRPILTLNGRERLSPPGALNPGSHPTGEKTWKNGGTLQSTTEGRDR